MKEVGYYNGELGSLDEIKCPILDRAVYFGDGCYDATHVHNGIIFALEDHLARFYNSCRLLRIDFQYTPEELTKILYEVVEKFDGENAILYWQASRGTALRKHQFPKDSKPNLMAMAVELEMTPPDKEFKVISLEDTRFLHCNIKTLNLIPSVIAATKAEEAGCDEVIFYRNGLVTEMAHSNVSIIKDGALRVHPNDNLVLPGIAIMHLKKLAADMGIPVIEEQFDMITCMNADEVIITSSGTLCNRITSVDNISVGGKAPELFKKLQDAAWAEYNEYTSKK